MSLQDLARSAAKAAARLRADLGVGPTDVVCPFDLAERMGIIVRLVDLPSMEGMYSPDPKSTILVSVERPLGRRRYTCGHEIGHHVFGHGASLDEFGEDESNSRKPEEFTAQRFAAALMMPKLAIESAFSRRGWSITRPSPEMVFTIAQEFGVGFTTLVTHLERNLRHITQSAAGILHRARLPELRRRLAGFKVNNDVVIVDQHWRRSTIDIEVGDVVLLPGNVQFEGACASIGTIPVRHLIGVAQGIGSVSLGSEGPPISIRVSRRAFTGLARYRYLEDFSDDE